jgi:hypothetical protein
MKMTKRTDELYLTALVTSLRRIPRLGKDKDMPEGTRYIQISDTLATEVADRLEKIAKRLHVRGDV